MKRKIPLKRFCRENRLLCSARRKEKEISVIGFYPS
jgi:hypothetical protein